MLSRIMTGDPMAPRSIAAFAERYSARNRWTKLTISEPPPARAAASTASASASVLPIGFSSSRWRPRRATANPAALRRPCGKLTTTPSSRSDASIGS